MGDGELGPDGLAQDLDGLVPAVVERAGADGARRAHAARRRASSGRSGSSLASRARLLRDRRVADGRFAPEDRRRVGRHEQLEAQLARHGRPDLLQEEPRERGAQLLGVGAVLHASGLPDHRQQVPFRLARAAPDRGALQRLDGAGEVRVGLHEADHAPADVAEHLPEAQLLAVTSRPPAAA